METELHINPQEYNEAVERSNVLLSPPPDLTEEEAIVWKEITGLNISSAHLFEKHLADTLLLAYSLF